MDVDPIVPQAGALPPACLRLTLTRRQPQCRGEVGIEGPALAATGAKPTLTANSSVFAAIIFVVVNIPTFARQARARLQWALPRACQRRRRKGAARAKTPSQSRTLGGPGPAASLLLWALGLLRHCEALPMAPQHA